MGTDLIRTGELARRLGVHPDTVTRWARPGGPLARAFFRRGYFKLVVLRADGLLPEHPTAAEVLRYAD